MRAACRRISSNASCLLAHETQSSSKEGILLTREERERIATLPFFTRTSYESSRPKRSIAKQEYLRKKLTDVKKAFGFDPNNPGYLPFKLPKDRSNPYLDTQSGLTIDPDTGKQILRGRQRLSVTKLLTKRWCELRESYDIYAKAPIYEHAQVVKGLETHQKLEDETHPVPEEWHEFIEDFEIAIPKDPLHELVGAWYESIVKLTNLFTMGEAREVLCHGYLDSESCQLVEGSVTTEEEVLVSGIIDHLILTRRDRAHGKPMGLSGCIDNGPISDITNTLKLLEKNKDFLRENYVIVLSDVKTRSIRKVPTQNSVVQSTKLQVMYYRSFMETLGANASVTFERLLINAKRRGMDIDRPIEPSKIVSIMAASDLITSDFRTLRDGGEIGFKPYDNHLSGRTEIETYDMAHFYDLITDMRVVQKFEEFFTSWSKPPTLRYFAARLAQMYHAVAPLLSDTLLIEYYYRGENFHNISFRYDRDLLKSECFSSGSFWFGKRNIEPIEPTLKNVMTYCKYCDYEEICLWRKQAAEKCHTLGSELAKLNKD